MLCFNPVLRVNEKTSDVQCVVTATIEQQLCHDNSTVSHNRSENTYAILLNSFLPHPERDQTAVGELSLYPTNSAIIVSLMRQN